MLARFLIVLALCLFLDAPASARADSLININTADEPTLETLPGIGASKAQGIIDYRTENGPFAAIEDIENVSGIGPSTFAEIESLITVGDADTPPSEPQTPPPAPSPAPAPAPAAAPASAEPLSVDAGSDRAGNTEVPLTFSASATGGSGAGITYVWSFGDGSQGSGSSVAKTYHFAGTYAVAVIASDGAESARDDFTLTVAPAQLRIQGVTGDGITIANDGALAVDLSGWRLYAGTGSFRVPDGTSILPQAHVLFPSAVTLLPVAFDTRLAYPDGLIAAAYGDPPPAAAATATAASSSAAQPPAGAAGSQKVQTVEPALTSDVIAPAHGAQTMIAPAAAAEPAAAGAAVLAAPATDTESEEPAAPARSTGAGRLLRSPWTYGALGVLVIAGGAFLLL